MSKFEEQATKTVGTLGLRREPMAIRFSDRGDPRGDSTRRIRVCEAFDAVRRKNVVLNFSKDNFICPGARHCTGFEPLPPEIVANVWTKTHKAFESANTALASIRKQPQPVKRGDFVILSPLRKAESDPNLVALFLNPEQADRLLGLVSFKGAEPFEYYPVSNICSAISNTLVKGRPEINFLAANSRRLAKWSPNELMVSMPFRDFETALDNVPLSGYGSTSGGQPRVQVPEG
jgi:uncharacterized protein (DUF169 family)